MFIIQMYYSSICEQGKSFKIKYEIFIDKKKEDIFEIIRVF